MEDDTDNTKNNLNLVFYEDPDTELDHLMNFKIEFRFSEFYCMYAILLSQLFVKDHLIVHICAHDTRRRRLVITEPKKKKILSNNYYDYRNYFKPRLSKLYQKRTNSQMKLIDFRADVAMH